MEAAAEARKRGGDGGDVDGGDGGPGGKRAKSGALPQEVLDTLERVRCRGVCVCVCVCVCVLLVRVVCGVPCVWCVCGARVGPSGSMQHVSHAAPRHATPRHATPTTSRHTWHQPRRHTHTHTQTNAELSAGRKKRGVPEGTASAEAVAAFTLRGSFPLHKTTQPGILALALHPTEVRDTGCARGRPCARVCTCVCVYVYVCMCV
jgi:hypothetical protein